MQAIPFLDQVKRGMHSLFARPADAAIDRKATLEAHAHGKRRSRKDPLYLTLQGHAARRMASYQVDVGGQKRLMIPRRILAATGNSPKALGYALRHPPIVDRASSLKKLQRTQRVAAAHLGDKLVVPVMPESPHIHPRHKRPAPAHQHLTARQRRAVARVESERAAADMAEAA